MKERTLLQKLVEDYDAVDSGLEDAAILIELGEEAEDEQALKEVRGGIARSGEEDRPDGICPYAFR